MAKNKNLIKDRSYQFALDIIQLYLKMQKQKEFVLSKKATKS